MIRTIAKRNIPRFVVAEAADIFSVIAVRLVVPAMPNTQLKPYSTKADEKMLSKKYLIVASWVIQSRRARNNRM